MNPSHITRSLCAACAAAPSSTAPARRASPPTCASRAIASPPSARTWPTHGADVLDVSGKIVAPGFIDVHTHDDQIVLAAPQMLPKISQGVTTVVVGNCGISLAPLVHADVPPPLNLLGGRQVRLPDDGRLCRSAGHGAAGGQRRGAGRPFDLARRDDGRSLSPGDAGRAGADGRAAARRHGRRRDGLELRRVLCDRRGRRHRRARAARARRRRRGRRLHDAHPRRDATRSSTRSTRRSPPAGAASVPVVVSHHKCAGPRNWGRTVETLAHIDAARRNSRSGSTVSVHRRLDGAAQRNGRRHHRHPDHLVDAAPGNGGAHARRHRGRMGLHAEGSVRAAAAWRRLLLPDARGRRAARAAAIRRP